MTARLRTIPKLYYFCFASEALSQGVESISLIFQALRKANKHHLLSIQMPEIQSAEYACAKISCFNRINRGNAAFCSCRDDMDRLEKLFTRTSSELRPLYINTPAVSKAVNAAMDKFMPPETKPYEYFDQLAAYGHEVAAIRAAMTFDKKSEKQGLNA